MRLGGNQPAVFPERGQGGRLFLVQYAQGLTWRDASRFRSDATGRGFIPVRQTAYGEFARIFNVGPLKSRIPIPSY